MPVVTRADCTTFERTGLEACQDNDLSKHYKNRMSAPGGDLDFNLVGTCDNENVSYNTSASTSTTTESNSETEESPSTLSNDEDEFVASILNDACAYNTFMCCWTQNDGDGMEDNTGVIWVIPFCLSRGCPSGINNRPTPQLQHVNTLLYTMTDIGAVIRNVMARRHNFTRALIL